MSELSYLRQRFVDAYTGEAAGNATLAAELAGYEAKNRNTLGSMAVELMALPEIQDAIEASRLEDPLIMSRLERQRFWSSVARGEGVDGNGKPPSWKDRLAAAKTLGKAQGDFIERVEHQGELVGGITYELSFSKRNEDQEPVEELDFSGLTPEERLTLFDLLKKSDNPALIIEMEADDD